MSLSSILEPLSRPLASLTARNAASNFIALGWLSMLSMLCIPVYIRLLGVSEWGLVSACASLQILSHFIDAGFSQIVPRWAAQEAHNPSRLRQYVGLFRRIYILLGLLMFVVLQVSAGYLSHRWFQVAVHRANALELAIRIVSFQFLFQFINNLHTGLWHGLQRQVLGNVLAVCFGTLKHATALTALMIGPPQVWLYALAYAIAAFLEMLVNWIVMRRIIGSAPFHETHERVTLGPLLKEISVLSGGILVGLLVSQLDRIVLSRTVDVESFGVYAVVATLAMAFLQLQSPVTRAYFPIIVHDIQSHGRVSSMHLKRLLIGTFFASTLPALLTCAFAPEVLTLWLHNPKIVNLGTAPLRLLLLAIALNSVYGCAYQIIIAKGLSHRVFQINLTALAMAALVIFFMGTSHGILLGGGIWMASALTQLLFGTIFLATSV